MNASWRLAPRCDVVYACDSQWWKLVGGLPQYGGLKVTRDAAALRYCRDVKVIAFDRQRDDIVFAPRGLVGWGGNSGFQALNLVVQWGCRRIVLVGYDMRIDLGLHWHGRHPPGMNNPTRHTIETWRRKLDAQAPVLAAAGIAVINASPLSALTGFPVMPLDAALRHFGAI